MYGLAKYVHIAGETCIPSRFGPFQFQILAEWLMNTKRTVKTYIATSTRKVFLLYTFFSAFLYDTDQSQIAKGTERIREHELTELDMVVFIELSSETELKLH